MSRFKTVSPLMIYMEPKELAKLRKYAKTFNVSISSIAREGVRMRMAGEDDPYNSGYNEALDMAMKIANNTSGAKMMFPSGKSFGELICEEIEQFRRRKFKQNDKKDDK